MMVLGALAALAQRLEFEVASVKQGGGFDGFIRRIPSTTLDCSPFHCGVSGNRFSDEAASLANLIADAYAVRLHQIENLPSWGDTGRDIYDVEATMPGAPPHALADARAMLRTLLEQRFALRIHRESKQAAVLVLSVDSKGSKLSSCANGDGAALLSWERQVEALAPLMEHPVLDRTGFFGRMCTVDREDAFEALLPTLFETSGPLGESSRLEIGSKLPSAIREKWGLKIESRKEPVDFIVIDHVERPSAN